MRGRCAISIQSLSCVGGERRQVVSGSRLRVLTSASAAVVAFAVAVATALPAGAGAQPIPPNSDASSRHGNEAENAIAVNPTNPQNVVAMSTLPDVPSGLFEGVSFDGGATWTRQVIGEGGDLGKICCDEQLAFDRFGNLWMTYLLNTNGNVPIALSTDGGLSFAKVTEIVPFKPTGSKSPNGATPKRLRGPAHKASADQPSIS